MAQNASEATAAMERQIAELRKDISDLSRVMSERLTGFYEEAREHAGEAYDDASSFARRAVHDVSGSAQALSTTARENPGATTAFLALVGLVGVVIGYCLGNVGAEEKRRSRWYR